MTAPVTLFETRRLGPYRIGHWDFVRRPSSEACVGILTSLLHNRDNPR